MARRAQGGYVHGVSKFRSVLVEDADVPAEPWGAGHGRYHLLVALHCLWCHRVTTARNVLGLRDTTSMDVAFPNRTTDDDPAAPNKRELTPRGSQH